MWEGAIRTLQSVAAGAGVAVVGCSATVAEAEFKLNIWPGAHISTTGVQAQCLISLDASALQTQCKCYHGNACAPDVCCSAS